MNRQHVRLVAGQELRDLFRNKGLWLSLLFQPIFLLLVMGLVGYAVEQRGAAFRTKEFKVVLQGSPQDVAALGGLLDEFNFRARTVDDVVRPVVGQDAEVGIGIPDGAADDIRHGKRVRLDVVYMRNRDQSEVALGRLRVALEAFSREQTQRRLREHGLSADLASPLDVRTRNAGSTERGARLQFGKFIPGMLLLQASGLVTAAANRIGGKKQQRSVEPLLLLPIARRDILLGAGLAALVIGVIPALAFIVPVTGLTFLPLAFVSGLSSPMAVIAAIVVSAPLVAALMVGVGLLLGTMSRDQEGGSAVGSLAFVPILGVGMLFMLMDSLPSQTHLFTVPAYGVALFAREAVVDGIRPGPLLIVAVTTIAYAGLLVRFSARLLQTERGVVRPGG